MTAALSVMVLAGGNSRRMGQDKALLPVDGVPLLQRTCRVGLQCASMVLIVTPRVTQYRAIAPVACEFVEEKPLTDEPLPQGPLLGFAQGLAHIQTPWVLLLACDLPYLQVSILQQWQHQIPDDQSAIALLPQRDHHWEPLCGFYHQRCLATLLPFIQQGGRSFQKWLTQIPVQAIALSASPAAAQQETHMLFNCNTPDDLRLLQSSHSIATEPL